ncbi:MAG: hypothetical protein AABY53_00650 [Bdellovibrionota bacterium]
MKLKNLSLLPLTILALALTCGCAKVDYDGRPRGVPQINQQGQPVVPAAPQQQRQPDVSAMPIIPPASTQANLPVISFVQSEVSMDSKLEAQLELQLSVASKLPVTVVVKLVDGSARHYRDFAGFKVRSSETSFTVVLAPGKTHVALPVIGGRHTRFCDSSFFAVINQRRLQNAKVLNGSDSAIIDVPCTLSED